MALTWGETEVKPAALIKTHSSGYRFKGDPS